jgi:DNA-binding MarR family transcriptional regulator
MARPVTKTAEPDFRKYAPFMDRDYNMFMLLGLALRSVFKARHCQVDALGLTPAEFHVLLLVEELGEASFPAEISRWLMRKPATVSRLLDRMEDRGLVRRRKDASNGKIKRVVMTEKGRRSLKQARSPDVMRLIMTMLSEDEFRQLWLLLEKLKDAARLQSDAMETLRWTKA